MSENVTPSGFYRDLTASEYTAKVDLRQDVEELEDSVKGIDYESDELFCLCDTAEEAERIAQAYGAVVESFKYGVAVLTIQKSSVANAMAAAADTTNNLPAVYPNYYRYPCTVNTNEEKFSDPFTKMDHSMYQFYHEMINSKFVWHAEDEAMLQRLSNMTVAVIDTGINAGHEEFEGIIVGEKDMADETSIEDIKGHGTKTAGLIANIANEFGGRGIAAGVKIMPIKTFSDAASASTEANNIRAMNYAIEQASTYNVRVINMSLGSIKFTSAYADSVRDANEAGIVVCASAGNDNCQSCHYPSDTEGVISVAALNSDFAKSEFSNYGPKVDIAAPGGDQRATAAANNFYKTERMYVSAMGESAAYDGINGTSAAAPVVSAVAALLIASDEDLYNNRNAAMLHK